jgi:4-diphosphocytidyl-2-C-methyl-D-erythritol kinase
LPDRARSWADAESAPAKVNLTLAVHHRRADGYHELESLVAFARLGDRLRLVPDQPLGIEVCGPTASDLGNAPNLVLRAAEKLRERIEGLRLGRFQLWKCLPIASGLGGGSSDAAAAVRLIAQVNALALDDPRVVEACQSVGADVLVCLSRRARFVGGFGEQLSEPVELPPLPAVLINSGRALATAAVFAQFDQLAAAAPSGGPDPGLRERAFDRAELLALLKSRTNALERAAVSLEPDIAVVLAALRALAGCELARMSGSGATCFGLFDTARSAIAAGRALRKSHPRWWVRATVLG